MVDDFYEIRNLLYTIGGIDLTAPFFSNGMIVNQKWFGADLIKINSPILNDFDLSKKVTMGLKFQEDLVPFNCSLLVNLFEKLKKDGGSFNYTGQLYQKEGLLHQDLRLLTLNFTKKTQSSQGRLMEQQKLFLFNLLQSEEFNGPNPMESISYL